VAAGVLVHLLVEVPLLGIVRRAILTDKAQAPQDDLLAVGSQSR
jgi:hypothetical protein